MSRTWSAQQLAIFDWFENGTGNRTIRARAGCGKTTTIIEGVNRAPEARILCCAFNKKIADDLTTQITNPNAVAKTLHAIGFSIVKRYWEGIRIQKDTDPVSRKNALTEQACVPTVLRLNEDPVAVPDAVKKLVTKLHCLGREIAPHATSGAELLDLAENFECEPDEDWRNEGWTIELVCAFAARAMFHAAERRPIAIDFSDMIFLPVRNHWMAKTYDLVVVDEAQDMTIAQLEIARGVCRGRICVVGDDRQAIYGFRGADSGSLDRLKRELGAEELALTTTYRCGRAIVERAAAIVPDFTAGPNNPEGTILGLHESRLTETALPGDFILSRMNAPLVSTAMSLLRAGKRTRVAGRDIGAGLLALVRRITKSAKSVTTFEERLTAWETREYARARKSAVNAEALERRLTLILDQADMLRSLANGVRNVAEIEDRIEALFTDDGLGQAGMITCSTVHRAKGLEADRVFILAETLKNHTEEEMNIRYVAITRAKNTLVMVSSAAAQARVA